MRTKPIPTPCTVDNLRARGFGQSEVPVVGRSAPAHHQYSKPLFCAGFLMLGLVSGLSQSVVTNAPVTAQENTPLIINISTLIICTNTPGSIRVAINASPAHGTLIITNLSSNFPSVTYVPNLNFTGNDSFMLTVSANNCSDNVSIQPIVVSTGTPISPPPPAPITNAPVRTAENLALTISIPSLLLCTNTPGPTIIDIITGPMHGSLITTNLASGSPSITYVPNLNFVGTDSLTWTVSANNCLEGSAIQPIIVNSNMPPPALTNSPVTTDFNTAVTIPITTIIACTNDPAGPIIVTITANPTHGTLITTNLSSNTPSVIYVPNLNFTGTDSFTRTASADNCLDNSIVQPIIVKQPNHPPTAQNLSVAVAANRSVVITLIGSDVDGDALTPNVGLPSHGSLSVTLGSSVVIYTPPTNFIGSDSFTYSMSDGHTNSNLATVSIAVKNGITIRDVTVTEGNTGKTNAVFVVSLTAPPTVPVSVAFHTVNGTATAGSDYVAANGVVLFPSSAINLPKPLIVTVNGDTLLEPNETFFVQLTSPTNGILLTNSAVCTILNDDRTIGVGQLTPELAVVRVGERLNYDLTWTHPERWRLLNTIDLIIVDDQSSILTVRWKEPENTFSLFNPHSGTFVRTAAAGSSARFETDAATLYLQQSSSQGSGPTGPSVTIHYSLSFKHQAAGRIFSVEAFVTDDFGDQQGFDPVGALTVQ